MSSRHFRRWGRVAFRVLHSWFALQRTGKVTAGLAALVGVGVVGLNVKLQAWLTTDWAHGLAVVLFVLLASALVALYGAESERAEPLVIEAVLEPERYFEDVWKASPPGPQRLASDLGLAPGLVSVSNEGDKHLASLTARCYIKSADGERVGIPCVWSDRSGDHFVTGGSHSADLGAGDRRLLLIAMAAQRECLWLRLASDRPLDASIGDIGKRGFYSRKGVRLDLHYTTIVEILFKTEGIEQTQRLRLSFKARRAVVMPL